MRWQWLNRRLEAGVVCFPHRAVARWDAWPAGRSNLDLLLVQRARVHRCCRCLLVVSDGLKLALWRYLLDLISGVAVHCLLLALRREVGVRQVGSLLFLRGLRLGQRPCHHVFQAAYHLWTLGPLFRLQEGVLRLSLIAALHLLDQLVLHLVGAVDVCSAGVMTFVIWAELEALPCFDLHWLGLA